MAVEAAEATLRATLADVREILKVTGIAPRRITLFTAPAWKRRVYGLAVWLAREGGVTMGALMERATADASLRERAKDVAAFAQQAVNDMTRRKGEELARAATLVDEKAYLDTAVAFLSREIGCPVAVHDADETGVWDPRAKARHAVPGRPAIFVE